MISWHRNISSNFEQHEAVVYKQQISIQVLHPQWTAIAQQLLPLSILLLPPLPPTSWCTRMWPARLRAPRWLRPHHREQQLPAGAFHECSQRAVALTIATVQHRLILRVWRFFPFRSCDQIRFPHVKPHQIRKACNRSSNADTVLFVRVKTFHQRFVRRDDKILSDFSKNNKFVSPSVHRFVRFLDHPIFLP